MISVLYHLLSWLSPCATKKLTPTKTFFKYIAKSRNRTRPRFQTVPTRAWCSRPASLTRSPSSSPATHATSGWTSTPRETRRDEASKSPSSPLKVPSPCNYVLHVSYEHFPFSDELGYLVDAIVNDNKIDSFDKSRPGDLSIQVQ